MEYLHKQQPIDGRYHNLTITGVPVTLTAINADGSVIDLGKATTDGYYGTYQIVWTPPAEGTYKIIASFASDESYSSSASATAVTVGPAPSEIKLPEQIVPSDYTWTIIGTGVGVILAVAVVGILILKKR